MGQAAGCFSLPKKAVARLFQIVHVEFVRQRNGLDGNRAIDARVAAQVHHAHGAASQLTENLVPTQVLRLFRVDAGASVAGRLTRRVVLELVGCQQAVLDVAESGIQVGHVAEHLAGFIVPVGPVQTQAQAIELRQQ